MESLNEGDLGRQARTLANAVRAAGGPGPVHEALDKLLRDLQAADVDARDLLPARAEPGVGFSLHEPRNGKTLWQFVADAAQAEICGTDFRDRFTAGNGAKQISAGSLVTAVMAQLGLPVMASGVAISISAVILAVGVDGFCRWAASPPDEPPVA